jgi:hypothetical protein|uniref:Uncharacterized protein n=1 Tax=Sipha flava TaxID=143950 RepID=A0A2S2QYZ8_9HEMI
MSKSGCESKSGHPPNPGTWQDTMAADVHTSNKTNFSLKYMIGSDRCSGKTSKRQLRYVYVCPVRRTRRVCEVCRRTDGLLYAADTVLSHALIRKVRCVNYNNVCACVCVRVRILYTVHDTKSETVIYV